MESEGGYQGAGDIGGISLRLAAGQLDLDGMEL